MVVLDLCLANIIKSSAEGREGLGGGGAAEEEIRIGIEAEFLGIEIGRVGVVGISDTDIDLPTDESEFLGKGRGARCVGFVGVGTVLLVAAIPIQRGKEPGGF